MHAHILHIIFFKLGLQQDFIVAIGHILGDAKIGAVVVQAPSATKPIHRRVAIDNEIIRPDDIPGRERGQVKSVDQPKGNCS